MNAPVAMPEAAQRLHNMWLDFVALRKDAETSGDGEDAVAAALAFKGIMAALCVASVTELDGLLTLLRG